VTASVECQSDYECSTSDLCHEGSCQNACKFVSCGQNAECRAQNHQGRCTCYPGYNGNPQFGCQRGKTFFEKKSHNFIQHLIIAQLPDVEPLEYGCTSNDDCPDYSACENGKCINPCAEHDPCARLASCRVNRHEAVCTCPDGYIGSPDVDCRLRKYCHLLPLVSVFSYFLPSM